MFITKFILQSLFLQTEQVICVLTTARIVLQTHAKKIQSNSLVTGSAKLAQNSSSGGSAPCCGCAGWLLDNPFKSFKLSFPPTPNLTQKTNKKKRIKQANKQAKKKKKMARRKREVVSSFHSG
uniref:Putative secreted protein n=1 Tax=Ixodes ricinus TaxID=34613 RepID=A0A6B0UP83_IXORI